MNWESKVFLIDKDVFAITCSRTGYYLFHIDKNTGIIASNGKKYLSSYKCNYLFVDNDKRLWAGTRTGLLKQKLRTTFVQSWFLNQEKKHGLSLRLSGICRYKNKIYLGSYNRFRGLLVLDTAAMQIEKEIIFYGGDNEWSEILDVQRYHKDTLWIATGKGLLWLDVNSYHYGCVLDRNGDTVLADSYPILCPPDKTGKAWLGEFMNGKAGYYDTLAKTFTFFTPDTKPALPFKGIKHIVYDTYGDVWIGGHGLTKWNSTTHCFDTMIISYAGTNKFNDDILAMSADKHGSLWLYNTENILLEYKIKEKRFHEHPVREALPQSVRSIANNIDDKLWFTTGSRLISYNYSTKKIHHFDQTDGLPTERASTRIIYFDKERRCYYSLHNDYLATFPESLPEAHASKKYLLITEIIFADTTFYNPANSLLRRYNQNNCSVHFTTLDFESSHDYDFYYRINNNDWLNLNGNHVIFFNSLPVGKHFIEIKAIGKVSENFMTGINIEISPPFWQRWWFVSLSIICLAAIIYFTYRYRLNQLRKVFAVRTKISQELHDEVGATLSGIAMYSHLTKEQIKHSNTAEVEKSLNIMQQSAGEMVNKLNDIVWLVNPDQDSLQKLIQRLEEYATDMATIKNMQVKVNVPEHLKEHSLPMESRRDIYLFCKEAINNAVKYSNGTLLELSIKEGSHTLEFSISDNGKGFDAESVRRGNGLDSMQKRADEIGAKLTIESKQNEGALVSMQVKIT